MNPLSSVGTGELIFILVIALILLGPERLPEIARGVGKTIRQLRDALQNMSSEFGEELASMQEVGQDIREGIRAVQDVRSLPRTLVGSAAAPLLETVEPLKATVKEAKEAVEAISSPAILEAEKSTSGETDLPPRSESATESKEGGSHSPDESRE
jgi:sec-independent protein translocase protein TatB